MDWMSWERLVNKVFGISYTSFYNPACYWKLPRGVYRCGRLKPDCVMIRQAKQGRKRIFVLDAKRYSYGLTGNVNDLPKVADIAKQIIYAEYIAEVMEPTADVYNAFIMPYSAASEGEVMKHIGIAKTGWKRSHRPYEYVHGILVDSRYLERLQEAEYEQARSLLATTIIFGGTVKVDVR